MKAKNRKVSPALQQKVNPGPAENAKAYRVGNPSGRENMSIPQGRGGAGVDHLISRKQ